MIEEFNVDSKAECGQKQKKYEQMPVHTLIL